MGGDLHFPHPQPQNPAAGGGGTAGVSRTECQLGSSAGDLTVSPVRFSGEGLKTRVFTGNNDAAAERPAGGRGINTKPALPTEELWAQLHPENEDRSAGKAHVTIQGADGENASVSMFHVRID